MVQTNNKILDAVQPSSKRRYHYVDVTLTLFASMVVPVFLYGICVVWILVSALITGFVTEYVCDRFSGKKRIPKRDYSWIITSLIVVMLMPATAPVWIVIFSVIFGLCVAKYPFGGTGNNIFNPAAAGLAFSSICWPEIMFRYPVPFSTQNVTELSLIQYGVSPASVLKVGGTPKIDYFDVLLGKFAGPLGATCMIVLVTCLFYLLFRHRVSPYIVFSAFGVVLVSAMFFPRVVTGVISSVIYEFSSGAFIFGVIFMANDPTTKPKTKSGQLFYGIIIGLITIIMRRFGEMELEFVFVILLANIFANSCDGYAFHIGKRLNKITEYSRRSFSAKRRKAGHNHA